VIASSESASEMKHATVVAIYKSHTEAETAVKQLRQFGVDMKTLSIVGRDYHSDEAVLGYYKAADRMKYWGKWGGIWGLVFGSAFFLVPGVGPLLVAGPLLSAIIAGVHGAVLVGSFSAIGAGLYSLGIPQNTILRYETELKDGKFIVIAHVASLESERTRKIIKETSPESLEEHLFASSGLRALTVRLLPI
jgi:hypothetical protein